MGSVTKRLAWVLALVPLLLALTFLSGGIRAGPDNSALASDSQPAIAISGQADSGPQQDGCLIGTNLDSDCDGFSDNLELHVGTLPFVPCGVGAWPPDINNDGRVDVIGDISTVAGNFGKSIFTGAPVRQDIGPEPVGDGFIDVIGDISKIAAFFDQKCS